MASIDGSIASRYRLLCRIGLAPEGMDRDTAARNADFDAIAAEYVHQRGLRTP